jgi:hypothetical protein
MIPAIFLLQPALPWLLAARCSVAYWQTVAETWAVINAMTAQADIVPFPLMPLPPHRAGARDAQQSAEIVQFTPGR